jgi:hypothetical protein
MPSDFHLLEHLTHTDVTSENNLTQEKQGLVRISILTGRGTKRVGVGWG